MGLMANHLFDQRSFYPLCPPSVNVNFDYTHIDQTALPVTPDILIAPSDLRYFVKSVKNSLVVNPGKLTKFNSGGTYARITVHGPRRNDIPQGGKAIPHGVPDRSVVQIAVDVNKYSFIFLFNYP